MNTKEYKTFLSDCKESIDWSEMDLSFDTTSDLAHEVFKNPRQACLKASELRRKFIDNIDENLLVFERKFSDNKGIVHWCVAYDDFLDGLFSLLKSKKVKAVNTFSSAFNIELGLDVIVIILVHNELQAIKTDCVSVNIALHKYAAAVQKTDMVADILQLTQVVGGDDCC